MFIWTTRLLKLWIFSVQHIYLDYTSIRNIRVGCSFGTLDAKNFRTLPATIWNSRSVITLLQGPVTKWCKNLVIIPITDWIKINLILTYTAQHSFPNKSSFKYEVKKGYFKWRFHTLKVMQTVPHFKIKYNIFISYEPDAQGHNTTLKVP